MKGNKGLIIALLVSLVVNGVMIGIYVGQKVSGRDRWAVREMNHKFLKGAPTEFNDEIRQAMREQKDEMRQSFRDLREARRQMVDLMKSESVTAQQLAAGFAAVRVAEEEMKGHLHTVLAEVLPDIPVENRLEVAKWHDKKMQGKDRSGPPRDKHGDRDKHREPQFPPPPPAEPES